MSLFSAGVPVAAEISRAARAISASSGPQDAWVLAYHPVARLNPYQALLYSRAWPAGFAPVAVVHLADLPAVRSALRLGTGAAVHLHWTSKVTENAPDADEANGRADAFLAELAELKSEGVRVVWTIHNRLPHACAHPEAEIRLRRRLSVLADVIHVMNPETSAEVSDIYPLPAKKLLLAPHPSYVGAYPSHFHRDLARYELGFDPDELVLSVLGSIQPYKGIDKLVEALAHPWPTRLRVVVAGIPGDDEPSRRLVDRLRAAPQVLSFPRRLDDQGMSRLAAATDAMILPYRASLNSGAAVLALSFGKPIIAPDLGPFRAYASRGYCLTYDSGDPDGLSRALHDAPAWLKQVDYDAMRADVASWSGQAVSQQFFAGLRRMLQPPQLVAATQ